MTTNTTLVNLALQAFGSRTTVTDAELSASSTNEAIQANLTFENTRDSLLRMAPWDCALNTRNLVYITSVPGTAQNSSPAQALWQRGLPRPPWAYEYQYPVDCLRACWIIPASQTGFTGVPITTAVTGSAPQTWLGGPVVFKVGIDQFHCANSVVVANGGTGHAVFDVITLASGATSSAPIGAPAQILVITVNGSGTILTAGVITAISGSTLPVGGSYFEIQTNPVAQGTTTGVGIDATFTLGWSTLVDQRVILTNQEYATLCYVRQVTDPNVWDPMFQDAFVDALGSDLVMALTGDKTLANMLVNKANSAISEARKVDGNEGLTINDVVPDWIRARGVAFDSQYQGPNSGFDWGGLLPLFG